MPPKKRTAAVRRVIALELVYHAIMGTVLGLAAGLLLASVDNFGIAPLIAHSNDPQTMLAVFLGSLTLALSVGATLTGFFFSMMEER
jgi:hypothetical protein